MYLQAFLYNAIPLINYTNPRRMFEIEHLIPCKTLGWNSPLPSPPKIKGVLCTPPPTLDQYPSLYILRSRTVTIQRILNPTLPSQCCITLNLIFSERGKPTLAGEGELFGEDGLCKMQPNLLGKELLWLFESNLVLSCALNGDPSIDFALIHIQCMHSHQITPEQKPCTCTNLCFFMQLFL